MGSKDFRSECIKHIAEVFGAVPQVTPPTHRYGISLEHVGSVGSLASRLKRLSSFKPPNEASEAPAADVVSSSEV